MTAKKKAARKRPAKVDGKPAVALSEVQRTAVAMLSRESGATKQQLCDALGSKFKTAPGYVSALIFRILRDKGYKVRAERVKGQREVVYRID